MTKAQIDRLAEWTSRRAVKLAIQRVNRGMAKLDTEKPDWLEYVNADKLQMRSGDYCICGQVFGSFYNRNVLSFLGISDLCDAKGVAATERHGFMASSLVPFSLLDVIWVKALQLRASTGQRRFLKVPE